MAAGAGGARRRPRRRRRPAAAVDAVLPGRLPGGGTARRGHHRHQRALPPHRDRPHPARARAPRSCSPSTPGTTPTSGLVDAAAGGLSRVARRRLAVGRRAARRHRRGRRGVAGERPLAPRRSHPTTRSRSSSRAAPPACRRAPGTRTGACSRWPRSRPAATRAASRPSASTSPPGCRSRTSARWRASRSRSRTWARRSSTTPSIRRAVLATIERERLRHLGGIPTQIDHAARPPRPPAPRPVVAAHRAARRRAVVAGAHPSRPGDARRRA